MSWLGEIARAFFAALFAGIGAFLDARARDAAMREAGQNEQKAADEKARADALGEMGTVADEQAKNNAVDRGGAAGVLERLRQAGH